METDIHELFATVMDVSEPLRKGIIGALICLGTVWSCPAQSPSNDDFAHRELLAGNSVIAHGTTANATHEGNSERSHHINGWVNYSVWYSWTAPATGLLHITANPGSESGQYPFLPRIGVYTGSELSRLTAMTPLTLSAVGPSERSFQVLEGMTVQIQVWIQERDD